MTKSVFTTSNVFLILTFVQFSLARSRPGRKVRHDLAKRFSQQNREFNVPELDPLPSPPKIRAVAKDKC